MPCMYVEEMAQLPCWLQDFGRCHTRGESQGMCNITCKPPLSSNKAEPTLALKPRGDTPLETDILIPNNKNSLHVQTPC